MKRSQISPLISAGWSHYIVTAPLSPRAHVAVSKKVRDFAEQEPSFQALGSSALNIAVMDLGILPESIEPLLRKSILKGVQGHASMRLQAVQFKTFSVSQENKEDSFLWLEFKDRVGAFSMLHTDLKKSLLDLVPETLLPGPFTRDNKNKFSKEKCFLLCGKFSSYKSDGYDHKFSTSSWINDLHLQKRPSHFIPMRGYQSVWSYSLPLETPELIDDDPEQEEMNQDLLARSSNKKIRLAYPLEGKSLAILNELEERIKESLSHRKSSFQSKQKNTKNRHKIRKKSS